MTTTTPTGMSVQALYKRYREDQLIVNRRYQRKLVWTTAEKQALITSIQKAYPIPLILLADGLQDTGLEIIDGMQRLNAIFTFIENDFAVDGKYFDVRELTRAKILAEQGVIEPVANQPLMTPDECAGFIEYQLPVTIYPAPSKEAVWDIFRRINSSGRHLSPQETRQAGILNDFAELVRVLSAEIRGDTSDETLLLHKMPAISIDSPRSRQGYGVHAENTFWCRQGILLSSQLRDSEDEQLLADIVASTVLHKPLSTSRDLLDKLYDESSAEYKELEVGLKTYSASRVQHEVKTVFSLVRTFIEEVSDAPNALRDLMRTKKSGNPMKGAFFALFVAFHELIFAEDLTPGNSKDIAKNLKNVDKRLTMERHHTTEDDRRKNIDTIKGLLRPSFVKRDPEALKSGASLLYDLENSLRRSAIETARYECKQGLLPLEKRTSSKGQKINTQLLSEIANYACAIANGGPGSDGFVFIGVADREAHAKRVKVIDGVEPKQIGERWVVGVDREATALGKSLEDYVRLVTESIENSDLSEPVKSQVVSQLDVVDYLGLHVVRIRIPAQQTPTFVGDAMYIRKNSSLVEASAKEAAAVAALFR